MKRINLRRKIERGRENERERERKRERSLLNVPIVDKAVCEENIWEYCTMDLWEGKGRVRGKE